MTWGSNIIGDDYDAYTDELDADRAWVIKQLQQHPLFKSEEITNPAFGADAGGPLSDGPSAATEQSHPKDEEKRRKEREKERVQAQPQEQVLLSDKLGKSPSALVKELRMKRRVHKQYRDDIDDAIKAIRMAKEEETNSILSSMPWLEQHLPAVQDFNLKDEDLRALSRFGEVRKVSLSQACKQWSVANDVLTKLSMIEGDFDDSQRKLWNESQQMKKESRQMWRNTLHQSEKLSKTELLSIEKASALLDFHGPMDSRTIHTHMTGGDGRSRGVPSVQQMGALLKTYGPEHDIYKHNNKWERQTTAIDLLMKDPWAYAAGFLDADGYITISKKGEPRAGFVATGERGKIHCENLYKMLGCGVLALDLKVHKTSKRSQHRLQFYSKADIEKLLKGTMNHLRLKKNQAQYVLEHLNLRGKDGDTIVKRRDELYRLVKWENWRDVKAEELLEEWNVDEQEVLSWARRDPEMIVSEVV